MTDLSRFAATNEEFSLDGNCFREQTPTHYRPLPSPPTGETK